MSILTYEYTHGPIHWSLLMQCQWFS